MSAFILIAALLAAAVLLCLLPPLLRRGADQANLHVLRDQARELDADLAGGGIGASEHAVARQELAARVLQDVHPATAPALPPRQWPTALALALGVPLAAAALYAWVGNPDGIGAGPRAPAAPRHEAPESLGTMVDQLARRLQDAPDDIEGLHMLARSYSALERYPEAAATYRRLATLLPQEAGVLADYADALASASGATLKGEPERLIARALALDPRHVKALSLSGSAAFERGDFARARQQWQAVLALVPPDSAFARATSASIAAAAVRMGEAPAAPALRGSVSLAGDLAGKLAGGLSPDATVFIYARAIGAKGPPLAVQRARVRDLPLAFVLDDSMGTGATAALSTHAQVLVGARISTSGSATPAPGDLEGSSQPVASDARDVQVRIDSRRH